MNNRLLKNKHLILSLTLFLAASLFVPSSVLPFAHASPGTGLVCITTSTSATSCPSSAPTIGPLTAGQTFSVGVFIQGSDAMGGFDIYVKSDPAFVNPTGAALGNLIASPSLTSICINGASTVGSCTVNAANGPGVVEVTTIESSGSNECGGISPCSGMAFTITYQVVGTGPDTSLSYPTAAGCSTSSVSSPPNTCVLVDDAFGTTLPENIQGATVSAPPVTQTGMVCIVFPSTNTTCATIFPPFGPFTVGSTFTVGVYVKGSQPFGGFDIYVAGNSTYVNPIGAALGNLIASPSLTSICINGQGDCTPNSANGQAVVEVSTIESSGTNDCPGSPACSGLAFTITYQVLAKTPTSSIVFARPPNPNACTPSSVGTTDFCVFVNDAQGPVLPENRQDAAFKQIVINDPTSTTLTCVPSPVLVGQSTTCTATVTDTASSGRSSPLGTVAFFTGSSGSFSLDTCPLSPSPGNTNQCFVTYTPSHVDTGTHSIDATYSGDPGVHSLSSATTFALTVLKATPSVSTGVVVDSTGGSPNPNGEPVGTSFHDNALLLGGYPVTGVSGTATYTLYPNSKCTAGTGTVVSVRTVSASNNVAGSDSVTPTPAGSYSFNAVYSGDSDNNAVTSSCEQFTVLPAPTFAAGKLHWTHHLSLAKTSNTQTWTAIVANSFTTSVNVVVRITGASATNPTHNFDVTCGVICVNTNGDVSTAAASAGPVSVAAGANSFSFSFSQSLIGSGLVNGDKVSFTATLYWTLGTSYTPSSTKSGAFAVVS